MSNYMNGIGLMYTGVEVAKMLGATRTSVNRWRKELNMSAPMCRQVKNRFVYSLKGIAYISEQTGRRVRGLKDICWD